MTIRQLIDTLLGRKKIVLITYALFLLGALAYAVFIPRAYTASASVLLDVRSPDPVVGYVLPATPAYMATQLDILMSERVGRKVITQTRLTESPGLRAQWQDATNGQGSFEAWVIAVLKKGLFVKPSKDSNALDIQYTAADPGFAAALVNAYVDAYLSTVAELRAEPARQTSDMFATQAREMRAKLEEAQQKLSEFQRDQGIADANDRYDTEMARLAELSSQLTAAQAQTGDALSRSASASSNGPEIMANPVVNSLKTELARSEAALKQMKANLGERNPNVLQAQAAIRELQDRINQEVERVRSSLGVNSQTAVARESFIRKQYEAQKDKLLKLRDMRDRLDVLRRDVDNARRDYDNLMARVGQNTLLSQSSQSSVSVLTRATPPSSSSVPNIPLNFALAIFLATFVSVTLVFGLEFFDRRVRSSDDIIELGEGFFFGHMPSIDKKASGVRRLFSKEDAYETFLPSQQLRLK